MARAWLLIIDQVYNVGLKELGFHYDYNKAIDEAYSIGREGSIVKRIKDIIKVRQEGTVKYWNWFKL